MGRTRLGNGLRTCVKLDTARPAPFTGSKGRRRFPSRARRTAIALLAAAALFPGPLRAAWAASDAPVPLDARVVWHRADLVYVALGDSGSVAPGDTLVIRSGKKQVAAAPIVSIAEGGLAVARVASGTLARERKLDRLRVLAARVPLPSPSTLRVGFPSERRAALAGCTGWTLRAPRDIAYRVEPMGRLGYRLTRPFPDSLVGREVPATYVAPPGAAWPDTIVASLFDDAAEEEIAFERGDLDVALFGPGELSARLRESPRWRNHILVEGAGGAGRSVLAPPELAPYVRALGAPAFLGMVDCGAGGGP